MAKTNPDLPDPAEVAALEWQQLHAAIRRSLAKRVARGDIESLSPAELSVFLDTCERAWSGDIAAHAFDVHLHNSRIPEDDNGFQGAYSHE